MSNSRAKGLRFQNARWCVRYSVGIITPIFGLCLSSGSSKFCLVYRLHWTFWSFSSFFIASQP